MSKIIKPAGLVEVKTPPSHPDRIMTNCDRCNFPTVCSPYQKAPEPDDANVGVYEYLCEYCSSVNDPDPRISYGVNLILEGVSFLVHRSNAPLNNFYRVLEGVQEGIDNGKFRHRDEGGEA